jgi:RHS repeat-associated protein
VVNPLLYRGERFDPTLGQYYLRARFYDPGTGRFTAMDPFRGYSSNPRTLHKYLYTHGNPVNGIDPTGLLEGGMTGLTVSISTTFSVMSMNLGLAGKVIGSLLLTLIFGGTLTIVDLQLRNQRRGACFAAGTPLLTPGGSKPIEQFREGDLVLSRDEDDPHGPVQAKPVQEVFVHEAEVLELCVAGRAIRTTAEHPFWVIGKGWLPANQVKPGDALLTPEGGTVAVERVAQTDERVPVYNLRIADFRTYFVGCDEWGFSVWAHNACIGVHHTGNAAAALIQASGAILPGSYVQPFSADSAGIQAMAAFLHSGVVTGAAGSDTTFIVDITAVPLGPTDINGGVRLNGPATDFITRIMDFGDPDEIDAAIPIVKQRYGVP